MYVISRVQIAFHTTRLHITLNVFTLHIPSHHTTFHDTHRSTSHHHCTFHIAYYIHVPRHISQTFNVATHLASDHYILHLASHYTSVCIPPHHAIHITPLAAFQSHSTLHRTIITSDRAHFPPWTSHSNIDYNSHYPTAHIPNHTTLHFNHSISVFHNNILHQHTTIFPMYHTIIQYRITIFHNASDIAHHTISHIFYIALYRTSQLH